VGWESYFQDPDLQALIRQALLANRDRALALARVDEARAMAGLAGSERFPHLALDTQAQRGRVPADMNLSRRPLLGSQFQSGVAMPSWEIDLWGRLSAQDRAAREAWMASEAASRAVTLSVISQVAQTWLQLAELDERLVLARQALASRTESLRIYARRVEVGATSRLALTQVQVLKAQAESLVAQLQQQRESTWQSLAVLTGGEPVRREPRWPELPQLAPGLPSGLVLRRPDIVAAEHTLQATDANVQAARAAYLPRLSLTAALGRLFALAESYPDLKADQNFRQLQEELSDTEDKVAFARQYYNDNVREWNTRIASVPDNLVAGLMRAQKAEYFELEGGAGAAPQVSF
jgi:multidrug efflux system outer membrane protein